MKILNLYAGIGGNRLYWGEEHEITAVEINPKIAQFYSKKFPKDKVEITDAHQYLLENFDKYDFIWSSPPCPTHSRIRKVAHAWWDDSNERQNAPVFPDMKLYEEILFMQGYSPFPQKWVVENVIGWYEPLIKPYELAFHYFWANFPICKMNARTRNHFGIIDELEERKKISVDELHGVDARMVLRNCVEPEVGKHIFECAFKQKTLL